MIPDRQASRLRRTTGFQRKLFSYLLLCLPDRAAQIAPADAVLYRDIALIGLAINFRSPVFHLDIAKLRQRDPLAARREQANILDRVHLIAVLGQIAQYQIVSPLFLQDLGERIATHGGLNRILNIRDVDLVARGLCPVTVRFRLGWPITRNSPRSWIPLMPRMIPTI